MTVKIIKCSSSLYWYKDSIGEKFEVTEDVFDFFKIDHEVEKFHTKVGGLLIDEKDCIITGP